MLLMHGLPVKAAAARLGHKNNVTTSTIYAHALSSADKRAAEIMGEAMNAKRRKKNTGQLTANTK
jgi:integrase